MDSLTQIALGAAVGEAVLGKEVGNRAALWGAICGTIPDLEERWSVVLEHIELMHDFYGDKSGARIARKHIEAYGKTLGFDPRPGMRLECAREQLKWLRAMCAEEIQTKVAA